MYKLTRYFAVVALVAVVIATIMIGVVYRYVAERNISALGEQQNAILARALANGIWPNIKMFINPTATSVNGFDREFIYPLIDKILHPLVDDLPVVKVKIFNEAGLTLYSSDIAEFGQLKTADYANLIAALQGGAVSKLAWREKFTGLRGDLHDVYVISSYLPLRDAKDTAIKGVIETYTDVTPHIRAIHSTQNKLFAFVFAVLFVVYLVLLVFVRRADISFHQRAQEREAHMRQVEEINASIDRSLSDATRDLVIARDEAVRANEVKSSFLANMSHELRTPLNAIIGYSEIILDSDHAPGNPALLADVRKINHAGRNLLSLVNDILDLSKIESGKMELAPVSVDIEQFIPELVEIVQPLVDARGNTLEITRDPSATAVLADRMRLRQVLLNLISNAAKFTQRGVIRVEFRARMAEPGRRVEISVRDTGIGMTDTELARIFEAFTQASVSITERYGGTGLGLTISRKLCLLMGGDISVSSEPGKGSEFTVHLPAGIPQPARDGAPEMRVAASS